MNFKSNSDTEIKRKQEFGEKAEKKPKTRKMTKPESWKICAAWGYTIVILGIGLPVWWLTTTIYRAKLPYDEIANLAEPKISMSVLLISQDAQDEHKVGPVLQKALSASRLFNLEFRSRVRSDPEEDAYVAFKSLEELDQRLGQLHENLQNSLVIFEAPPLLFKGPQVLAFGQGRTLMYKSGCDPEKLAGAVKSVLGMGILDNIATAIMSPSKDKNPSWTLRRPITAPSLDVLLSLMIPEPEKYKPTWDIEKAVEQYLQPMLETISALYKVNVKSQILYLTSLSLKPTYDPNGFNTVTSDDLGLSIDIGSQLSSHVSSSQTLNFLTYIPTQKQSPLKILDQQKRVLETNAFLVPRWGGVLILNTNQTELDMPLIMNTFMTQFHDLLGLDYYDSDLVLKVSNQVICPTERDFLLRLGCVENLAVSRMTMQSLSHLLTQISNIVINEDVSQEVFSAVENYGTALTQAKKGDLESTFEKSQKSFISSEKAFFDDTLLALLYFPEDQKYAIYIPLFLPVAISFYGSITMIWSSFKK